MQNYKEIHIWKFPPTSTFIRLNKNFRINIFKQLKSQSESIKDLLNKINKLSLKYRIKRKYNTGHLSSWIKGSKKDRGKIKNINIPLWLLIEISKVLAKTNKTGNKVMRNIEKNIEYYTGVGNLIQ